MRGDKQPVRAQAARAHGARGFLTSDLRVIVPRAEVRQYDVTRLTVELFSNELGDRSVGQVSMPAHQSLLERPWIRTDPQHFKVVIRLHDQDIRSTKLIENGVW